MAPTVWNARRKWLGNLVPALFWLPPTALGIFLMARLGQFTGPGLWSLIAGTVLGWLATNQFGLWENGRMRRQLERIMEVRGEANSDALFVGIATPRFSSSLDPHEDVGFLEILPDSVRFVSETRSIEISRLDLKEVRFRPNIHSILMLGRWVSLEGASGGKPIRLMIEPRQRPTLLGNRRRGKTLLVRLRTWLRAPA